MNPFVYLLEDEATIVNIVDKSGNVLVKADLFELHAICSESLRLLKKDNIEAVLAWATQLTKLLSDKLGITISPTSAYFLHNQILKQMEEVKKNTDQLVKSLNSTESIPTS